MQSLSQIVELRLSHGALSCLEKKKKILHYLYVIAEEEHSIGFPLTSQTVKSQLVNVRLLQAKRQNVGT